MMERRISPEAMKKAREYAQRKTTIFQKRLAAFKERQKRMLVEGEKRKMRAEQLKGLIRTAKQEMESATPDARTVETAELFAKEYLQDLERFCLNLRKMRRQGEKINQASEKALKEKIVNIKPIAPFDALFNLEMANVEEFLKSIQKWKAEN